MVTVAQLVEHRVVIPDVAGSIPVGHTGCERRDLNHGKECTRLLHVGPVFYAHLMTNRERMIDPDIQTEIDAQWAAMPEEWRNLPDDEVTACGMPLGLVFPDLYDENNQPRDWNK